MWKTYKFIKTKGGFFKRKKKIWPLPLDGSFEFSDFWIIRLIARYSFRTIHFLLKVSTICSSFTVHLWFSIFKLSKITSREIFKNSITRKKKNGPFANPFLTNLIPLRSDWIHLVEQYWNMGKTLEKQTKFSTPQLMVVTLTNFHNMLTSYVNLGINFNAPETNNNFFFLFIFFLW